MTQPMNIHYAKCAEEVLATNHPHIGRVAPPSWRLLFGILMSRNHTISGFEAQTEGEWESVAILAQPDTDLFMLTIGKSFVLVTMKEGSKRIPVIQKRWTRQSRTSTPSHFLAGLVPIEDKYRDADGLKWMHSYGASWQEEELVAFDASGAESIRLTIE
jgi:hypothetical protein